MISKLRERSWKFLGPKENSCKFLGSKENSWKFLGPISSAEFSSDFSGNVLQGFHTLYLSANNKSMNSPTAANHQRTPLKDVSPASRQIHDNIENVMVPIHVISLLQISEEPASTFKYYVPSTILQPVIGNLVKKYGTVFDSRSITTEEDNLIYCLTWNLDVDDLVDEDRQFLHDDTDVKWKDDCGNKYSQNMMTPSDIIGQAIIIDAIVTIYLW